MEETTSSTSVLRSSLVRQREFLLNVSDGVGRSNFFRYDLSDLSLPDRSRMILLVVVRRFFLAISISATTSSTMVFRTLGSLASSTRLSGLSSLGYWWWYSCQCWMTTLMAVRVHAALALRLKLNYGRTLIDIYKFMVWYSCLIYAAVFRKV
jgi:hypothetical protein